MFSSTILVSIALSFTISLTEAVIMKSSKPSNGYQKGYATQDKEPLGQKSICQTNCGLSGDNHGAHDMAPGVYAAAIGPGMGGGADNCAPCGACYSIVNSGSPYCAWDDPKCPVHSGPPDQNGPQEIKVMIVNHCTDCGEVPGHFDINASPGWDNPVIWWKQLPASACRAGGGISAGAADEYAQVLGGGNSGGGGIRDAAAGLAGGAGNATTTTTTTAAGTAGTGTGAPSTGTKATKGKKKGTGKCKKSRRKRED